MPTDKMTFRKDVRGDGNGTQVSFVPLSTLTDLSQGEFVGWDRTNKNLIRFVRDGSTSDYLGISRDTQVGLAKLGNQSALAAATGAVGFVSIWLTGVHNITGTSGETYKNADRVFMSGTNTQAITTVTGSPAGKIVGRVWLPDGTTITAGASTNVPVMIDGYTINSGGAESTT